MASRHQKQHVAWEFRTGKRTIPHDRFEKIGGHSPRVRCVLCGASGFGTMNPTVQELTGSFWQIMCLLDHPVKCRCGLHFRDAQHLGQHVAARVHPGRELMHGPVHSG